MNIYGGVQTGFGDPFAGGGGLGGGMGGGGGGGVVGGLKMNELRNQLQTTNVNMLEKASMAPTPAARLSGSTAFGIVDSFDFGGMGDLKTKLPGAQHDDWLGVGGKGPGGGNANVNGNAPSVEEHFGSGNGLKEQLARKGFVSGDVKPVDLISELQMQQKLQEQQMMQLQQMPPQVAQIIPRTSQQQRPSPGGSAARTFDSMLRNELQTQQKTLDVRYPSNSVEEDEEKVAKMKAREKKYKSLNKESTLARLEKRFMIFRSKKGRPKEILLIHKIWLVLLLITLIIDIASLSLCNANRKLGSKFRDTMNGYSSTAGFVAASPDINGVADVYDQAGWLLYSGNVSLGILTILGLLPTGVIAVMRYRGHSVLVTRLVFQAFFLCGVWIGISLALFAAGALAVFSQATGQRGQFDSACDVVGLGDPKAGSKCHTDLDDAINWTNNTITAPAALMFVICLLLCLVSLMAMQLRRLVILGTEDRIELVSAEIRAMTPPRTSPPGSTNGSSAFNKFGPNGPFAPVAAPGPAALPNDVAAANASMFGSTEDDDKKARGKRPPRLSSAVNSLTTDADNIISLPAHQQQAKGKGQSASPKARQPPQNASPKAKQPSSLPPPTIVPVIPEKFVQDLPAAPMSFEDQRAAAVGSFLAIPPGAVKPPPPAQPK